ncbi:MAG: response regulator [Spirochaetia bacterium]|jgi:two-component system chemotaxis response regulator CheY|nr:response regulator [Spirochaetia bacterium]
MKSGVLIVDDLQFVRISIKEVLEKEGIPVAGEAADGMAALEMYEKTRPDIVLLDITMPVMDGLSALKFLKTKYPESKVIMCSALGQQKYIIRAIQLGASDFVVKPFKPERLISSIRKTLRG